MLSCPARRKESKTDRDEKDTITDNEIQTSEIPREDPEVKSRMCPPYPQRVVKGDQLGRCVIVTV